MSEIIRRSVKVCYIDTCNVLWWTTGPIPVARVSLSADLGGHWSLL